MCSSVNSLNKTTVCTQTKLPLKQLRTFRNQLKRTFTLLINQLVHKSEKKQIKRLKIPPPQQLSNSKLGNKPRSKKTRLKRNEILKLKYYFNNDELKRQVSVEIQKAVIKNERAKRKTSETGAGVKTSKEIKRGMRPLDVLAVSRPNAKSEDELL